MFSRKTGYSMLVLFALASAASASYIGITVTVSTPQLASGGSFPVNVSVVNSGDEDAHDVQLSLQLPDGFQSSPVFIGILSPNMPYDAVFEVNASDSAKAGTYPIVVKTHYADANAYPFSTVSPTFFRFKEPTPIMLRATMKEISVAAGGDTSQNLVLEASNLDDKPHKILVRFHLPDELKADYDSTTLELNPKDSGTVSVPVKSFGALAGSSYLVFASMEYDDSGLHYSSTASGMVKIVADGQSSTAMPSVSWLPLAVILVLLAAFIVYQLKK